MTGTEQTEPYDVFCWKCKEEHVLRFRDDDEGVIWVCTNCGAECMSSRADLPKNAKMRLLGSEGRIINGEE